MNGNSINTRCPACHTAFNVTTGQLKVADGLVRCGGCLHVFNAQPSAEDPLSGKEATPNQMAAATQAPTPIIAKRTTRTPAASPEAAHQPQSIQQDAKPRAQQSNQLSKQLTKQLTKPPIKQPTKQQPIQLPLPDNDFEPYEETLIEGALARYITNFFIISLVALCMTQVFWFQKDQWIQEERFRPIYKALYTLIEQPLPARRSPDLIINKQFIIQPHEELADAIRISILLENAADFSQPFPALQLIFTDLKGRITAQRTLPASEYINTQLFPQQLMPSRQPIQIQLDMMAPGRRAVGYQLNLISG